MKMAPKRMKKVTVDASPMKATKKQKISHILNALLIPSSSPKIFSIDKDFRRYCTYFHGQEIIFGRSFNLSCLSATRLRFTELLSQSDINSLALLEQDVFPKLVWLFYYNIAIDQECLSSTIHR